MAKDTKWIAGKNGSLKLVDKATNEELNPPMDEKGNLLPPFVGELPQPPVGGPVDMQQEELNAATEEAIRGAKEKEELDKRAAASFAAGAALPAAGAAMNAGGDIGRAANAYTAMQLGKPALTGQAIQAASPYMIPAYSVGKTVYDYATKPELSSALKAKFLADQAAAKNQMIPQLNVPTASEDVGEKLATNTFQNGPIGAVASVGGDLLSALKGALSKTGQFVGQNIVQPVSNVADTAYGAVQDVAGPVLNSRLAQGAQGLLNMTAYGPASSAISGFLGGNRPQLAGGAAGTGTGERADYFNEYHPSGVAQEVTAITAPMDNEISAVDMQINRMTMKLMAGDKSVIPQLNALQSYKNSIVKNKQETIAATESQRKQSQDYGNYVSGSKEHEAMTTESNALKKIDNVSVDLNEAADRQDGRSVGAIGQQLVDFIRTTTNQAVTEDQRATLNPLLEQAHGLLSLDKSGNSTVAPENIPVMLRTIAGIRKELATDLDSYVSRPNSGIDARTKQYLFSNPNVETGEKTAAKLIQVNIPGHGVVNGAMAVDKDGHNLAIDPETGYPYRLAQDGKTIMGIEMKSGKLANPNNLNQYIAGKNGEPLDGKVPDSDKIAAYVYIGAPQAVDENGRPQFDSFGFMVPDTDKQGVLVPKRTGNEDSFNVVYNKLVNPQVKSASEVSNRTNITGLQNRATLDSMLSRMRDVNASGAGLSAIARQFNLTGVADWIDNSMRQGRNVSYQDLANELAGGKLSVPTAAPNPAGVAPAKPAPAPASGWTAQDEQRLKNFEAMGNTIKVAELQAKKKKAGK